MRSEKLKIQDFRLKIKGSKSSIFNFQSSINRGFTLIELMAVVAIITILAAIMIPNVAKHVENGRIARASADIDVLVKAIGLFQIDHEGDLPGDLSVLWTDPKGPYISTDQQQSLTTPWKTTNYEYAPASGTNSYTVQAKDKKGMVKAEKKINF